MFLKNFKIKSKFLLVFSAIGFMFLLSVIIAIFNVNTVSNSLEIFYNQPFSVVNITYDMKLSLVSAERSIYKAISTEDIASTEKYINDARAQLNTLENSLNEIDTKFLGDRQLIDDFRKIIAGAIPVGKDIMAYALSNENKKALDLVNQQYEISLENASNILDKMSEQSKSDATEFYSIGKRTKVNSMAQLVITSIIAFIIMLVMCIDITKCITRPILEIEKAVTDMSNGNLKAVIVYKSKDEMGHLADIIRNMMYTLSTYISNIDDVLNKLSNKDLSPEIDIEYKGDFASIKKSLLGIIKAFNQISYKLIDMSAQISNGSQIIADSSQSLAENATNQSNFINELVLTVDDITEQVNKNAEKAQNINSISVSSMNEIKSGNEYMEKLLHAMNKITSQSNEISNIIKIIDDISSQTNLLSLNASIEAARAGEHGAGFAVVANEIGKLANECSQAAKNTANLIDGSIQAVEEGSKLTNDTAQVLNKIVDTSSQTNSVMNEIAEACKFQADDLNDLLEGIRQMADIIEENHSSTQESSASSQQLMEQSKILYKIMKEFKLKENQSLAEV